VLQTPFLTVHPKSSQLTWSTSVPSAQQRTAADCAKSVHLALLVLKEPFATMTPPGHGVEVHEFSPSNLQPDPFASSNQDRFARNSRLFSVCCVHMWYVYVCIAVCCVYCLRVPPRCTSELQPKSIGPEQCGNPHCEDRHHQKRYSESTHEGFQGSLSNQVVCMT